MFVLLAVCALTGELPYWMASFPQLRVCMLGNNRLSGKIPMKLFRETLEELDLSNNALEGELPSTVGDATKLTCLWLNGNKLEGEMNAVVHGAGVPALPAMKIIAGDIPSSFSKCRLLDNLNLGDNPKLKG